jgi:hypothetical protein
MATIIGKIKIKVSFVFRLARKNLARNKKSVIFFMERWSKSGTYSQNMTLSYTGLTQPATSGLYFDGFEARRFSAIGLLPDPGIPRPRSSLLCPPRAAAGSGSPGATVTYCAIAGQSIAMRRDGELHFILSAHTSTRSGQVSA